MPRFSLSGHPLLLGFEQVEQMVERAAKSGSDSYPPYNIELVSEDAYRITLAVAGFRPEDLDATIEEQNLLVVRGRSAEVEPDAEPRVFLHRGIAARQFQKTFVLAEGVEVIGAQLADGLLHINLIRRAPASTVKRIDIDRA
ncbi:MAG: Hsp20 family protein [Neomegalonema sp.]|nr:Hsp20 family protein [Neomegalonema sp.]